MKPTAVWVSKHLYDMFPIKNGLKPGDALAPLLFSIALVYESRTVHVNQEDLKLDGAHHLLV